MFALSLSLFSTKRWPLEDHPVSHDYNNCFSAESSSLLHFPTTLQQPQFDKLDHSPPSTVGSNESKTSPVTKKQLKHNASERDSRKKMSNLFSSLVPADHEKGLSFPTTVSRVLKYIPELQLQVEGLTQKRYELWSKISKQENVTLQEERQVKSTARESRRSLSAVSTTRLPDTEDAIQISTIKSSHSFISRIFRSLEEDGLELLNASSFQSSGGRVFYNLHLQVDMFSNLESDREFKQQAHILICMRKLVVLCHHRSVRSHACWGEPDCLRYCNVFLKEKLL